MIHLKRLSERAALRDFAAITVLLALNAYIALDLFRTEYLSHLESIEAAYIGISRYILDHGFNLDWFPLWYGGIPFQNTYPPLLHALVAATSLLLGISPAHAHHVTVAAFYCAGPVFLYWFAKRLSGDWRIAAAASLVYSITAPSALLAPSIRTWASAQDPVRFLAIINFGDGPHVASVALIPLALLAIHRSLEIRTPARMYLAALASAAVVLTNWLGAFALALSVISYLLARFALDKPDLRAVVRIGLIAALAYGCALPWIPPSTIARVQHNAQYVIGKYPLTTMHFVYLALALALTALVWWILRRVRASLLTGFSCLLGLFTSLLVMVHDYFDVSLMPQPHRYHHEIDLALSLAAVCIAAALLKRLDRRWVAAVLILFIAVAVLQTKHVRRRARVSVGTIQMENTVEYQMAAWLRDNLPGRRVFATGSIQFWLNAFSDTPQVGGGFGQGIVNDQNPVVHFGVPWTIGDGADTAVWLKVYGAAAVVVSEQGSRDAFGFNWRDPAKFRGVLPEAYRNGADVLYRVPLRSDALAHVIRREDVVRRAPINNVDLDPVRGLVRSLDDTSLPVAAMNCIQPGDCTVRADIAADRVLYVQITYHRGWRASVNGEDRPIERDGLGQMTVDPRCSGPCEVRLVYNGGLEMTLAKTIAVACNTFGLLWLGLATVRRRRHNALTTNHQPLTTS